MEKPTAPVPAEYISNPFELIKPSYETLKLNWTTLLLAFLIPLGVVLATGLVVLVAMLVHNSVATILAFTIGGIGVLAAVVVGIMLFPVLPIVMLKSAHGEKIDLADAFAQGRPYIGRLVGFTILTGLAILGGYVLLVVPGIIFTAWFALAAYVALEENLGVVDSMKRSKQLVKGHVIEMLGMQGLPALVGFLNFIPILGFIVSTVFQVIYTPAPVVRYVQLKTLGDKVTKPHWVNYVLVLVPIVALLLGLGSSVANLRNSSQPPLNAPIINYGQ